MQVGGDAHAVEPVDKLGRLMEIVLIYKRAHADVRGLLDTLGRGDDAVAHVAPVGVLHIPPVHQHLSVAGVHHVARVEVAVVEGHHKRGGLEHRSRLEQVAHGIVFLLVILSVLVARHVDDGLDIARLNLHEHGHALGGVDLLKLGDERLLGEVLHAHIDGRDYVAAVLGLHTDARHIAAARFLPVPHSRFAAQHGVVAQFEPEARCVLAGIETADGAQG